MNPATPVLRAHLLGELELVADVGGATVVQLAGQVPNPVSPDRGHWPSYVYPHLRALERRGLVVRIRDRDLRSHRWRLA